MKKRRQLHLWIGLLTSFFILIEAVTGLLLSEPWLIGINKSEMRAGMEHRAASGNQNTEQGTVPQGKDNTPPQETNQNESPQISKPKALSSEEGNGNFSLMGFIKGLHEGRVGSANAKILVDITAIGLIILTVTGISLSIQILKAQSRRKKITKNIQENIV
jgi:hypothetical protein